MLVKKMKYEDFFGNEIEGEFMFHLNEADVTKLLVSGGKGGITLDRMLERVITEKDNEKIIEVFDDLLHRSYGRVSVDGKRFEKSEEIWNEFYQSNAYPKLFMEMVGDDKKAAEFIAQILPKELLESVRKKVSDDPDSIPDKVKNYIPEGVFKEVK